MITIMAGAGTAQRALGQGSATGFSVSGPAWEIRFALNWSLIDVVPVNSLPFTAATAAGGDIGWSQYDQFCNITNYGPFHATAADFGPDEQSSATITLYPPQHPINPLVQCARNAGLTLVGFASATSHSSITTGSLSVEFGSAVGTHYKACNSSYFLKPLLCLTGAGGGTGFMADSLTFTPGENPRLLISASTDIDVAFISCQNNETTGVTLRRAVLLRYRGVSGNNLIFRGDGLAIIDTIEGANQQPELYGLFEGGVPTTNAPFQIEIPIPQGAASEPFSFQIFGSASDTFNAGDLNGDGLLTRADAELLVNLIGTSWSDDAYQLAGDMNLDGVINDVDAAILYHRCRSCFSPCNPADIAFSDGSGAPDGQLDNGDFNLFMTAFFGGAPAGYPANPADIADSSGDPGPDGQVDNGDLTLFISAYFDGCP
jgi:hypothetical protein